MKSTKIMTIIWLRHANDENGEMSVDNKLSGTDEKRCKRIYNELIAKYGQPEVVFVSPFRRTKYTALQMGIPKEKIKFDIRLSRYFSSREKNQDVAQSTKTIVSKISKVSIDQLINENWNDFRQRIKDFRHSIESYRQRGKFVICITHALVIKQVAERYQLKIPSLLSFLQPIKTPYLSNKDGASIVRHQPTRGGRKISEIRK